jgi:hypothetical protein
MPTIIPRYINTMRNWRVCKIDIAAKIILIEACFANTANRVCPSMRVRLLDGTSAEVLDQSWNTWVRVWPALCDLPCVVGLKYDGSFNSYLPFAH